MVDISRTGREGRPATHKGARRFLDSFSPIYHLNRQTLTLLIDVARSDANEGAWSRWRQIGAQLGGLNDPSLDAIGHCPFLLIDAGFGSPSLWRLPAREYAEIAQQELSFAPSVLEARLGNLARATCLLAWHLIQTDSNAAQLALGITAATTSAIAPLSLTDLQEISMHQVSSGAFRPRWHDRPDAWQRLIVAAKDAHQGWSSSVATRGLQLFLRELLALE